MIDNPNVIIYADHLLPASQTFVMSQGEALQEYTPYYVGSRLVNGLSLPDNRYFAVNGGGFWGKLKEAKHLLWQFDKQLIEQVKDISPVLIHAHFGPDAVTALPLAKHLNIPLIVTFHGFDITIKDEYARRSNYRHRRYLRHRDTLKKESSRFVAVSDFIKNKLIEEDFSKDKITRHYIGVDVDKFTPDNSARHPVVLFVGRLVEKKGCEYLIRAMSEVQARYDEAELLIIGDGPLKTELESLAQSNLKKYKFLGRQTQAEVKQWLNRARLFCVPSIVAQNGDTEAFGIVFIEAQAMGTPVVSFASGGIPEAVAHGKTGFLAPEKNYHKLAEYILQLLKDKALWAKFSENGKHRVRGEFNLETQTQRLEEIYDKVIRQER